MRQKNPGAWISVVVNGFVELKRVNSLEEELRLSADDVVFGPWRSDQASGADLVVSMEPGIVLDAWLRGHAVELLEDGELGIDLSGLKGREVATFAALMDAQVLRAGSVGGRARFSEIIPLLDAQVRDNPAAPGFVLQDLRRGLQEIGRLIGKDDREGAIAFIRNRLETEPQDADLLERLGKLHLQLRQLDQAITAFDHSLAIQPENAAALRARAQARIQNGEMTRGVGQDLWDAYVVGGKRDLRLLEDYFNYEWERAPLNETLLTQYQDVVRQALVGAKPGAGKGNSLVSRLAAMQLEAGMIDAALRNLKAALVRGENPTGFTRLHATLGIEAGMKPLARPRQTVLNHLIRNDTLFSQLLDEADGDIVIVGNGPQELGRGRGVEIDSHKLVVRFNTYQTAFPQSEDYGLKTDLWVRMPPTGYVKTESSAACRNIIVTGANRLNRPIGITEWLKNLIEQGKQVGVFPKDPFYELVAKLGKVPTAGLVIAYMLYRETGPVDPDRIFGCSFASDLIEGNAVYHHSDAAATSGLRHSFDIEHAFFQTIRKTGSRHYHVPALERRRARDVPTLSIDSFPLTPRPWSIEAEAARFDRVLSVTSGLDGYQIFGHKVEVIPLKEAREFAAAEPGIIDQLPARGKVLTADLPRRRTLILGFGLGPSGQLGQQLAGKLGMPYMSAEYGLISSCHLPSEKKFNFSLILDDVGAFFDTEHHSRLEMLLDAGFGAQTNELVTRARALLKTVLDHDITKYNNAPRMQLSAPTPGRRRILVIDQTSGDLSIKYGQCSTYSFRDMLDHALAQPDADVILKPHPESLAGAKGANFDLKALKDLPNLTVLTDNCNILSLMSQVDEVYVMVSGVGLEALMAGKKVRCFGVPFYAGRGLTIDMVPPSRPRRPLSIEELVAGVFLQYHLWFDPVTGEPTTAENCLERLLPMLEQETALVHDGKQSHVLALKHPSDARAYQALRAGEQPVDIRVGEARVKVGDTVVDITDGSALFTLAMARHGVYRAHHVLPLESAGAALADDVITVHGMPPNTPAKGDEPPDTLATRFEGEPISLLRLAVTARPVEILESARGIFDSLTAPAAVLCFLPRRAVPRASSLLSPWYEAPLAANTDAQGKLSLTAADTQPDAGHQDAGWYLFQRAAGQKGAAQ
ncbi:MAG: hypothetical protein ACK4GT_07790 [Pararhodobacter sp.]